MAEQHLRSYRIFINSMNAISGDNKDGLYKINLPIENSDKYRKWQYGIEYFCYDTNSPLAGVPNTWVIDIPTFTQNDSYSTMTNNNSYSVLPVRGGVFFQDTLNFSKLGLPINNINLFVNGMINIRILNSNGVLATDVGAYCVWSMIIIIWEVPDADAVSNPDILKY